MIASASTFAIAARNASSSAASTGEWAARSSPSGESLGADWDLLAFGRGGAGVDSSGAAGSQDRGRDVAPERFAADHDGFVDQVADIFALKSSATELGDCGLLTQAHLQLGFGCGQALASPVEGLGGTANLMLHGVNDSAMAPSSS